MMKWIEKTLLGIGGISWILILITIGIILILLIPTSKIDNRNFAKQSEMIAITLEWSRLAPFPEETENFNIHTEGNSFTRTFKGSFNCPKDVLDSWVKDSPGLQDAKVEDISKAKKKYIISPGGGADYAEVIIDYETNKVEFRVSWS